MRITRNQLRQMINEELLREADLGEGSVEILGRLNRIESKLDDILQAVRPGGRPSSDGAQIPSRLQAAMMAAVKKSWEEMKNAAVEEED